MATRVPSVCLALASMLALVPRIADACGGCFSPPGPDKVTTVESHRMVIALGTERTVLWDQITYSGNPDDFVWVLPVPSPDALVELADPAFFDLIDTHTAPILIP